MKSQLHSENPTSSRTISDGNRSGTVLLFGEVLADNFPDRSVLGGAPFNVARHLKAFKQTPVLITRLGDDALRDEIMGLMKQNGMEASAVQIDKTYPTGQVKVHIEGVGHRFEILPRQAYDFIDRDAVSAAVFSTHPSLVYFGTLAQRHETSRQSLEVLLNGTSGTKFLDINLRAPWYDQNILRQSLQYADIVKVNDEELGLLGKMFGLSGVEPQSQIMQLMNQFEINRAVITCGKYGAWQINSQGEKVEAAVKNSKTKLMDTVGAGDGFSAVFMLGILLHWPVDKTLDRANDFAAAICKIRGAIPERADFYKPFIREWGL